MHSVELIPFLFIHTFQPSINPSIHPLNKGTLSTICQRELIQSPNRCFTIPSVEHTGIEM